MRCIKCNKNKRKTSFYKNQSAYCIPCTKDWRKTNYITTKDYTIFRNSLYMQLNMDKQLGYSKKWQKNNKDYVRKYYREYYEKNKDGIEMYRKLVELCKKDGLFYNEEN